MAKEKGNGYTLSSCPSHFMVVSFLFCYNANGAQTIRLFLCRNCWIGIPMNAEYSGWFP